MPDVTPGGLRAQAGRYDEATSVNARRAAEWLRAAAVEIERLRREMDACLDGLRLARFETGAVARAAVQVAAYHLEAALRGQGGAKDV